ncbi:MAG: PLP-dependent aminotransferase family protein [Abitibacteriaceae bacterium]|nr:PLP-dependent aminotransferase family protein [Abditibacteriaceae bacterium]
MITHGYQQQPDNLYDQVAGHIIHLIEGGTLLAGERVPSVRRLSAQEQVSISTVLQAYRRLENEGWIEARPQSGYYVRPVRALPPEPEVSQPPLEATPVKVSELMMQVVQGAQRPGMMRLSSTEPDPSLLPLQQLSRCLAIVNREQTGETLSYGIPAGYKPLKVQIARRALEAGCVLTPDDIVITSGCQEALQLSLRAVANPGDTILLESPTYYGVLQIIESLGLCALEIPTHPRNGLSLEALEYALEQHPVKACLLSPNFNNPLGSLMTEANKERLVTLLAEREIPLIEDDVYGDLSFEGPRPKAAKAYDQNGLVLLCASFSKTIAPGYRVGWVVPGRFRQRVEYLKTVTTFATSMPPQMAVAEFLAKGSYDHHLRKIRRFYSQHVQQMAQMVSSYFPPGTKIARPAGGQFLWIELPRGADSLKLFQQALQHGICIVPGPIFSATGKYRNCLRLSCTQPPSKRLEMALQQLGLLAHACVTAVD